jgi:hypothetical protein
MFDDGSAGLLKRMSAQSRAESCAAAARLATIGELMALRMVQDGGASDDWAFDVVDAVSCEIAAALGISRGLALSHIRYADALRNKLPKVGATFLAGDINEAAFRTLVFRIGLICDADVLAAVDADLAERMPRWGSMSRSQLTARIDKAIAKVDRDAVRRRRDPIAEREVVVGDIGNGMAELHATLFGPDAYAVDGQLTALAATVCEHDPRTVAQRRADAMSALAAKADRLGCRCAQPDCPAGGKAASAVVIHVIAEQSTVDGIGDSPGAMADYEGLIPPELIAELAASARLRPLIHPGDAAPEPGYTPSQALADYVRCRDLTCRFPGCNAPAVRCDLDHTIPDGQGGPTHASNLKCLCRFHHLLKTFWGWHDEQLRDGTVIWTSPTGDKYVTHPGGALLFPSLSVPTGPCTAAPRPADRGADKTAMMPRRTRTRAQQRAAAIAAERRANHLARTTPPEKPYLPDEFLAYADTFAEASDSDPPPF